MTVILKLIISLLLTLAVLACLLLMFNLPYELRFIKAEFNYLFVGLLYASLALLTITRILLIEDSYLRKPFLIISLMVVVFPCLFVLSVALEHYQRVKRNDGLDVQMQLVSETVVDSGYSRIYKKADLNLIELYGFSFSNSKGVSYSSHSGTRYIPTKQVIRMERPVNEYLKLVK